MLRILLVISCVWFFERNLFAIRKKGGTPVPVYFCQGTGDCGEKLKTLAITVDLSFEC